MPETLTKTKVKSKVKVGTLTGVILAGFAMLAAVGYLTYKGAYKNEPIIPINSQKLITKNSGVFPVQIYLPSWPRKISGAPSNITYGDIDQDKKPEVIFGTSEQLIYAYNSDGSLVPNWPIEIAGYNGNSTPAMADVDMDGKMDLIINTPTEAYVVSGDASARTNWPIKVDLTAEQSPVVADFSGDKKLEILVYDNNKIYLLNEDGSVIGGWPKTVEGVITSKIAAGDLDGDKLDEIVLTTLSNNKTTLRVFKNNGQEIEKYRKEINNNSSLASLGLGDINGKEGLDMAITFNNGEVLAISNDGKYLFNKTTGKKFGELALGDVNNDKKVELAFADQEQIHILNETGAEINNWPKNTKETIGFINIADINNDGNQDILATADDRIYGYEINGELLRESMPLVTESTGGNFLTYPTLADINNDNVFEIMAGLSDDSVYIWNLADYYKKSGKAWWPIERADIENKGSVK